VGTFLCVHIFDCYEKDIFKILFLQLEPLLGCWTAVVMFPGCKQLHCELCQS